MVAKKIVQDIVPSSRRSIRLIPLRNREREEIIYEEPEEEIKTPIKKVKRLKKEEYVEEDIKIIKERPKKEGKNRFSKILFFILIFLCIGIICIALSFLYSKAIVTITPEKLNLNISGNFLAKKDVKNDGSFSYQIITLTDESHKIIDAVDGSLIQTKAKGTMTLFNSYGVATQKIVAGSRLSNSSGLVYRTLNTVIIPGMKAVKGEATPGSINVDVIADQVGENYNIKKASIIDDDFKFLGYKGSKKYEGFYSRLKTDISGGFSGVKKTINAELEKTTIAELRSELEGKMINNIKSIIPDGYVMFNNAYTIDYTQISSSTDSKDKADIGIKGIMYGIIFETKPLINSIAKKEIKSTNLNNYRIEGMNDLNFKIINIKDFSPKKGNTLSFSLNGPVNIIGIVSENDLKNALAGIKLKDALDTIKGNPSIKNINVLLTPFWMRSFPNSEKSIIIEYK